MRPNILLMIPHDLGDHLGCYGYQGVATPALDRLAAEGARAANYFAASPECSPSRACMMTGLHCHQNGMMGLANFGWQLQVPHLAQRLAAAGYATHLFGVQHECGAGHEPLGYQHGHAIGNGCRVGPVCEALEAFLAAPERQDATDAPWFACAGFFDVHRRWPGEATVSPAAVGVPPYLPDTAVVRDEFAHFYTNIQTMDTAIGRVLERLQQSGLAQDTLVIFTSDHGAPFPGAKATLYDPGLRLPYILRWPGRIRAGEVHPQLLSNVDFLPTLLEAIGLPAVDGLAGRSFWRLLTGEPYDAHEAVYASVFYDVAYDPMYSVRTLTHRYIRSFAVRPEDAADVDPVVLSTFAAGRWVRCDDYDVLSSATWQSFDHAPGPPPAEELYDLSGTAERHNLAGDPAHAALLAELRDRLDRFLAATDSPLPRQHIPPPPCQVEKARHYRHPTGPAWQKFYGSEPSA